MNTMADALKKAGLITEEQHKANTEPKIENMQYPARKDAWELFRNSSIENPTFAKITITDTKRDIYGDYGKPFASWEGVVACEGTKVVSIEESKWDARQAEMATFRGIEKGIDLNKEEVSSRRLEPMHALALEKGDFVIQAILPKTPERVQQHKDIRDQISMTIHAYVFPEFKAPLVPMIQDKTRSFNDVYKEQMEVRKASIEAMNNPLTTHVYEVKGLEDHDDAMKWMLKNHPEEAISFVYSTNTGNFNLQPSIDTMTEKSYLGTRGEREDYVKEMGAKLGIEVGKFDYREADKALSGKEPEKENFAIAYEKNGMVYTVTHGFESALEAEHWREDKVTDGHLPSNSFVFVTKGKFNAAKLFPVEQAQKVKFDQAKTQAPWQPPKVKEPKKVNKNKTKELDR